MAVARKDCDTWYHIPKSRFNGGPEERKEGGPEERKELDYLSDPTETPARNAFLGSFRDCVLRAWEMSDREYNIPKSRFQDPEYNRTAYRKPSEPGIVSRLIRFPVTLAHCISMAWEASDHFYNLPKSRYQDADFVRELMRLVPEPKGKLLYRPYTIGLGMVVSDSRGKGWTIELPEEKHDGEFIAAFIGEGKGEKPELEM